MSRHYRFERVDTTISYAHKHEAAKTAGERPYWRAEVILRLFEYGGQEAARAPAMEMAEELSEIRRMNRHPVFKWIMKIWRHMIK